MKGHRLIPADSHRKWRNGVGEEAFGSDQSEWIMKRSGLVWNFHLSKKEKLKKTKKGGRLKKRFQLAADVKTAPRKSLVPDYLFTLIFQKAEGN